MLIFLDIKTTGFEKEDKICAIALLAESTNTKLLQYELINEGKKISSKASSIHHIRNEMLKDKPKLVNTDIYTFLQEHNRAQTILVGHAIERTLLKIQEYGFVFKGAVIDTQRVTKHLVQECENYSLQFLRYELQLYKEEESGLIAHHALSDVKLIGLLYRYLEQLRSQEEMQNLSFTKVLLEKFPFGKYEGRYIEEIVMQERSYIEWMLTKVLDLDEDLRYSIDYYLQG